MQAQDVLRESVTRTTKQKHTNTHTHTHTHTLSNTNIPVNNAGTRGFARELYVALYLLYLLHIFMLLHLLYAGTRGLARELHVAAASFCFF